MGWWTLDPSEDSLWGFFCFHERNTPATKHPLTTMTTPEDRRTKKEEEIEESRFWKRVFAGAGLALSPVVVFASLPPLVLTAGICLVYSSTSAAYYAGKEVTDLEKLKSGFY